MSSYLSIEVDVILLMRRIQATVKESSLPIRSASLISSSGLSEFKRNCVAAASLASSYRSNSFLSSFEDFSVYSRVKREWPWTTDVITVESSTSGR
jgi:hypothetical protein